jgi:cytochrome c peroxidase
MRRALAFRLALAFPSCLLALAFLACGRSEQANEEGAAAGRAASPAPSAAAPAPWEVPADFEPVPIPADNPMTLAKVQLGRKLYFDPRLSGDGKLACYTCHVCEHGLTDGRPTAVGAFGKTITRSAPTMWNVGYHDSLYWDGRSPTLEKQAVAAWKGANMGAKPDSVVTALQNDPDYARAFQEVFGGPMSVDHAGMALAAYMRTILCVDTPQDRALRGDATALDAAARRGKDLFYGKARCGACHLGNLFTDLKYHNVGIGKPDADPGRFKVSQNPRDTGAFKTPTLRDVTRSAPYFHDGSVATLEEAVDIMAGGGIANPHLDPLLQDNKLTAAEKSDLIAFLHALTCPCDSQALSLAPR